jgi:hypothetical protein
MKHLIIGTPKVEMQLKTFRGSEKLMNELKELINVRFDGVSTVRIASTEGNGKSYLLNAIANELRKEGIRISFLNLSSDGGFNDLTEYQLNPILRSPFVFIDNLQFVFKNFEQQEKFQIFLKELAARNGKLIYTYNEEDRTENRLFVDAYFSDLHLPFYLPPIGVDDRKKWAIEKLNDAIVDKIPEAFFTLKNSNRDFLHSIEPFILQYKSDNGINFKEIRLLEHKLHVLEIRMLRNKLAILELQPVKNVLIREERYENAADIRQQQKALITELDDIRDELDSLKILPKPSEAAMRLYIYYISLQNSFKLHEEALFEAVAFIKNQLNDLNSKKKELNFETDKNERLSVFLEIVKWTETLNRFYVKS